MFKILSLKVRKKIGKTILTTNFKERDGPKITDRKSFKLGNTNWKLLKD